MICTENLHGYARYVIIAYVVYNRIIFVGGMNHAFGQTRENPRSGGAPDFLYIAPRRLRWLGKQQVHQHRHGRHGGHILPDRRRDGGDPEQGDSRYECECAVHGSDGREHQHAEGRLGRSRHRAERYHLLCCERHGDVQGQEGREPARHRSALPRDMPDRHA